MAGETHSIGPANTHLPLLMFVLFMTNCTKSLVSWKTTAWTWTLNGTKAKAFQFSLLLFISQAASDRATTKWPFYSLLLSDYIRPSNFPHDPHLFPCFRDWENPTFSQDSKPAKGPQAAKTKKPVKKELRAWCKTYIYHREVFCLLWETLHVPYATHEWESFCWRQQATTEPTTRDRLKTNLKAVNNGSSPLQRTVSPLGLKS